MPVKKTLKKCILMAILPMLLAGCDKGVEVINVLPGITSEPVEETQPGMLAQGDVSYEVPTLVSGIKVDLNGYLPEAEKTAVIVAQMIPKSFNVIDKKSGRIAYTGNVELKETSEDSDGNKTGICDFTDLTDEGEYYIETEILGVSNYFTIRDGIFEEMMTDAFANLKALENTNSVQKVLLEGTSDTYIEVGGGWYTQSYRRDTVDACLAVLDLLTAYEYYPESLKTYKDDLKTTVNNEIAWLIKMQNGETGGVYNGVFATDDEGLIVGGETTKATAYFCACLSKYSYVFKNLDSENAKKCYNAASKAWSCLTANKDLVAAEQYYRAAVEIYRASGSDAAKKVINSYLEDNYDKAFETRASVDAAITYLATSRSVKVDYCTTLMATLMERTETKSKGAKASRYYTGDDVDDASLVLRNAVELSVVDYIITNREYDRVLENYLHYICGRNKDCKKSELLTTSPDSIAESVMLIAKLMTVRGK